MLGPRFTNCSRSAHDPRPRLATRSISPASATGEEVTMTRSRAVLGMFGLAAWFSASLAACVATPEDPAPGRAEEVGQAQEAVGEGGTCTLFSQFCDPGLTCC